MITIILSFALISLSFIELYNTYRIQKQKKKLIQLMHKEFIKPKTIQKNNINLAFENIIAKNSFSIGFFLRFENQYLWKIYAAVVVFAIFFIFNRLINFATLSQSTLLITLLIIIILIIFVPRKIIKSQAEKKIRRVSKDLPLIIDIIAIMIKSGMTIENSFSYLSTRVKPINSDVSTILERACIMMDVNGIVAALELIYREIPSKEMRMFCVTLKRSIDYGNSIYDVLLDLSSEIRELQKLDIEEKTAAISAKMTLPMMLFILLPVLVVITGPVILKIMSMF